MLLDIAPVTDAGLLPDCTPSLMPFCISYTGPAPVSRYFRPRPAPPPLALRSFSSATTLVASSSSTSMLTETQSSLSAVSVQSLSHESQCAEDELSSTTRPCTATSTAAPRRGSRFLAAFRGRQMYGQAVDVPSGYGGLVLQAPNGKGKEAAIKAKPNSRPRAATRRSRRTTLDDGADGRDDGSCYPDAGMDPPVPTKKLVPISTFGSFMLWTPDRPLDEGRDEYVKTLVEWTRLAAEIHSYDEGE